MNRDHGEEGRLHLDPEELRGRLTDRGLINANVGQRENDNGHMNGLERMRASDTMGG